MRQGASEDSYAGSCKDLRRESCAARTGAHCHGQRQAEFREFQKSAGGGIPRRLPRVRCHPPRRRGQRRADIQVEGQVFPPSAGAHGASGCRPRGRGLEISALLRHHRRRQGLGQGRDGLQEHPLRHHAQRERAHRRGLRPRAGCLSLLLGQRGDLGPRRALLPRLAEERGRHSRRRH